MYREKEITEKVYNNIKNSIKLQHRIDAIFMNSDNSKTSDSPRLLLNFSDKINLKRSDKYVALSNLSIYYTWKNIKKSYKNSKFKLSAPTWNEEFELPDGSYSASDIQDYFEYILKEHREKKTDNHSMEIYPNKIENRITFKIKTGYYLRLLIPEAMKLLGSTTGKITKDKNGENVPHLEITEVVLVHCNIVNNDYQHDSRVLYTFIPNKPFGQLLVFLLKICFLKTFNSEFSYIEMWFTDQNSKPLEIEDKINITLVVN